MTLALSLLAALVLLLTYVSGYAWGYCAGVREATDVARSETGAESVRHG